MNLRPFAPENSGETLNHEHPTRRFLRPAMSAGATALTLAAAFFFHNQAGRTARVPSPEELTREFSEQRGHCFGVDPTTDEAQDLYGLFIVDGDRVIIAKWKYDEAGNRTVNAEPIRHNGQGRFDGAALVYHWDSVHRQFVPEQPSTYFTDLDACPPEPASTVPQTLPPPAS